MAELSLDITEDILVQLKPKDLTRYKSVCKSWSSLISSHHFVTSHLNYNLKKKDNNNETGDTRIVLAGRSGNAYKCDIVGSSNGLVCLCVGAELLVVNPSTRQVKKLESPPNIPDFPYQSSLRLGFGYDSSIDDYKVVIGFKNTCTDDKYRFLVLTLKTNVWKSVSLELDDKLFFNGVLCKGAIHRFAFDQSNNPKIVSFDLSKEVFKEIPTPPLRRCDYFRGHYKLGTMKDRLCIFRDCSITPFDRRELWLMKNYNVQEPESIWEQMLPPPPCVDSLHQERMDYIPPKSLSGHTNIWMLEDSRAPVLVQRVIAPHRNTTNHIWLSTTSECNYKYDKHVFVESLVSPHGTGNDNKGRLMQKRS